MRFFKTSYLLIFLFGIVTTTFGLNNSSGLEVPGMGELNGQLTDQETHEPVIGATVVLLNNDSSIAKGATSDRSGKFTIKNILPGKYPLQISFIGYERKKMLVEINSMTPTNLNIDMPVSALDLGTVEILGTSSEVFTRTPGAATKLDAKTVELIQPMGTQEILQHVPGVYGFADDGMGNSRINIGIRGLYPRRSSRVLILEDGMPIQPAIYLYPNAYYNPPTERLDEIEVIKSSAAIKYGPQTMGGVINYKTRKPRREFGATAQVVGGTNNYKSTFLSIGGWGTASLHPELQVLYKSADGFRDNNHFDQFNTTLKFNILTRKKSNIYIKANVNYEDAAATYTGLTEYSFATNPTFNPKKYDNFKINRQALDVIYNKEYTSNLISTTKLYMNHFGRDWWKENDVFVEAAAYEENPNDIQPVAWYNEGNLIRVGNGQDNMGVLRDFYVFGVEHSYDYNYNICEHVSSNLEIGGRVHFDRFMDNKKKGFTPDARDGVYYTEDSLGTIDIVGQSYHYETFGLASYVLNKFEINNNLTITPGFRFEGFEQERIDRLHGNVYADKSTFVLLPGLGANYELKKYNLFGGIHRGFTPPSDGTLKVLNFGTGLTEGLDLDAEKSWNTEIGLRRNAKAVSFEVTAFNMDIKNYVAAGRGTVFKNLGKVRYTGIENAIRIAPNYMGKRMKYVPDIHITYTYLYTTVIEGVIQSALSTSDVDISGNKLPYAPKHVYNVGISKEFGCGLSLRADVHHVAGVYTDFENILKPDNRGDQGKIPGYRIYNASASYQISKKFKVFVTGKNLFDNIYIGSRLHSNPRQKIASLSSGILPGSRRQVNIGLKYQL